MAAELGYRGLLPPRVFNLTEYCLRFCEERATFEALRVVHSAREGDFQTWTYAAVKQAVLRVGRHLGEVYGLAVKDRVAIRLRNRSSYAFSFFGAVAAGFVPVPISPDLTERELAFILDDSEAAAIVLDETLPHQPFNPGLTAIPEQAVLTAMIAGPEGQFRKTLANDPAFLVYTSGTTAAPKGVLHAHRSAWGRRPMYEGWYGVTPQDRMLHAGSFNWTFTLGTGLMDPWANGAAAVVYTGEKDPSVWVKLIDKHRISMFAAVPGVYRQILNRDSGQLRGLGCLRHGLSAGEALPNAVEGEWRERIGTPLFEALGQSELSTYISSAPSVPRKAGMAGRPQPGRCVRILDEGSLSPLPSGCEGLIAVHRSDPALMLGYANRPVEEAEVLRGDWFVGGDAGRADEDGYIAHLGRRNDFMNAGGFRVSPLEVEQELARHPLVAEVAAAQVTVREGVSIVAAFVVPREDGPVEGAAAQLSAHAAVTLAAYKRPKEYVFVQTLPRTSNGKVKRSELDAIFQRASSAINRSNS